VAHRAAAIAEGDRFRAVLVALRADVLGRVAGAHQEQVLALELTGIAEVMCMQDAAREMLQAFEIRRVRRRKMAGGHDHVVELLRCKLVLPYVTDSDAELAGVVRILHPLHRGVETEDRKSTRLNSSHVKI